MLMKPHQSAGERESGTWRCKTIRCTNGADTPACPAPQCLAVGPSVSQLQQIYKSSLPPSQTKQRRSTKRNPRESLMRALPQL